MYTPGDDYEEKVSMSFIKEIQLKLQGRKENSEQVCYNSITVDLFVNIKVVLNFRG